MDAIDDELSREKGGAAHGKSAAHKILENTQFIYMMANQLALLDLSTLNQYLRRLEGSPTAGGMSDILRSDGMRSNSSPRSHRASPIPMRLLT
jgi:hypothetical protein